MKKIISLLLLAHIYFIASAQTSSKNLSQDNALKLLVKSVATYDTISVPILDYTIAFNQSSVYNFRLDSIKKTIPLAYNEYVQKYIDIYSKRKDHFGKMLGLSSYYFPVFEKALKAYDIPTELKYLPIIESSMDPTAVSRVGATGMWQFMFGTAKAYGLIINNYVDERRDPLRESYAAAAYLRDAYNELGDWLLAIASYNCGKGNITRAIEKAGSRDFWEIRDYLPKETRNYVPAFIAAVYMMNCARSHQITEIKPDFNIAIDTVQIDHFITFSQLAKATNEDESTLAMLNPSFKKKIVNGTKDVPKMIVLPKVQLPYFAKVYRLLNHDLEEQNLIAKVVNIKSPQKISVVALETKSSYFYHKVIVGQTLDKIAILYNVEVKDLREWNNLPNYLIIPGQHLKIYNLGYTPKMAGYKTQGDFISYKVKVGDTLSSIANKFEGTSVVGIEALNGLNNKVLKPGLVLKIGKG